jgi:hypothetical protein
MKLIGMIQRLQIQREPLKVGERPNRRYDPSPLLAVDGLLLTAEGAIGVLDDGGQWIDVHHAGHPRTRHSGGLNGLSIGFTSHYDHMRAYFGRNLPGGIAGENILVEYAEIMSLAEISPRLVIEDDFSGDLVYLTGITVAAPCVEFSQFLAGDDADPEVIKHALQFLHGGIRGFYAALEPGQGEVIIHPGDRLYVPD